LGLGCTVASHLSDAEAQEMSAPWRSGNLISILLFLGSPSCRPDAALFLRVEAALRVPEDCDRVTLSATHATGEVALPPTSFGVDDGLAFPFSYALRDWRQETAHTRVTLSVEAFKSGARAKPWSFVRRTVPLRRGELEEVVIALCPGCGSD
jgi:hypothetical protein